MLRLVQFLTSTSVRGSAVYASGEVAAFEAAVAAELVQRGCATVWPLEDPAAAGGFSVFVDSAPVDGFSVFVDAAPAGGFSVFVDPNAPVVTDPQAIAAAMEDTVDDDAAEGNGQDAVPALASPRAADAPASVGAVDDATVGPGRRRRKRGAQA